MKTFTLAFAAMLLTSFPAFSAPPESGPDKSTQAIRRKLNNIVIPRLELRDVTVEQAITILQQRAKALDPEGKGVNIVLKIPQTDAAAPLEKK